MSDTQTLPEVDTDRRLQYQPPYHVILLDDDHHTFDYVIRMLKALFGFSEEKGAETAKIVDREGRAILITTTREHAEFKQDQIHSFGPDLQSSTPTGSMTAIIEPAE